MSYIILNPQGAVAIIEKLADITQTPFPSYTPQPTIVITEIHEVTREATIEVTREVIKEVTVLVTPSPPTYAECGEGILAYLEDLGDGYMIGQGPTFLREENVKNGPLTLAMVSACFISDEGVKSDPKDIEEGYENSVVFYDIYGQPHIYRIIVGGRSLPQHASRDNLIFSAYIPKEKTAKKITVGFMTFDEFNERSKDWFREQGHRHVFLALYVTDDGDGTMSDHYTRIYQNSDIYARIVEAIKTGVGFPEEGPEDFYLWALGLE